MSDPLESHLDTIEQAFQSALQLHAAGRIAEAREAYRAILDANPDHARALHSLGVLEKNAGNAILGVELIARAIALQPGAAEFHNNLGDAFGLLARNDEAIAAFENAIARSPDYVKAYNNLGMALTRVGRFGDAVKTLLHAVSLRPNYAKAVANLGSVLTQCGRQAEAIACFRRAIDIEPNYQMAHSNLLMGLNYLEHDPGELFAAHRNWAKQFADPLTPAQTTPVIPHRPLRIGYVSGDFCGHAVSSFFMPVLAHHDRARFHVTCFSNLLSGDDVTDFMRAKADGWRDIVSLDDQAAAHLVRDQRIDILIDLAGHSARNRLMLFARKPAPVQVTWLGYPNTTGMSAIDYRITDAHADPPGATEALHSERLMRLTSCWCYAAPTSAPDVAPPPSAAGPGGPAPTFGSFNTLAKVTLTMIETWGRVLHAAPGSRMIIKAAAAGDESGRQRMRDELARHGIASDRVELRGRDADGRRHLESYGEIDVMLDTHPYHGTTMTCEAMWMGVPVVTLAGASHVSRVGVSLLTSGGLTELIASSRDEYVAIAAALAQDASRLVALRQSMRRKMMSSPLLDAERFTRELESAYEAMWQLRLETQRQ